LRKDKAPSASLGRFRIAECNLSVADNMLQDMGKFRQKKGSISRVLGVEMHYV
jgi:hypothetical protein